MSVHEYPVMRAKKYTVLKSARTRGGKYEMVMQRDNFGMFEIIFSESGSIRGVTARNTLAAINAEWDRSIKDSAQFDGRTYLPA